ncbi:hypothetical protein GGF31_007654 [Allomyces arbusculus]|nr:hypothetical protein GGF31_007654 [Allomyces arbusculus]
MVSPTSDTDNAAQLTARGLDSWGADVFGPTGAPGYWDRASIAAAPSSADALRNCTFITLTPTHDTAIYYGPTCPPAPRNPFADPGFWFGLLAPFVVFGLFLGVFAIKDKLNAEPQVTWSGWARRAWRAVSRWVWSWRWVSAFRARVPRVRRVERTVVDDPTGENVQVDNGAQVRWISVPDAHASAVTESENEQRGNVQWWQWTANENGSGYMLVDMADAHGPAPAALAPPDDEKCRNEEHDKDGAPPPYTVGSSARWS